MKKIILGSGLFIAVTFILLNQFSNNESSNIEQIVKVSKSEKIFEIQQRGCCSWHGGVSGCSGGSVVCSDGTYSPSCTCNSNIDPTVGHSI